MTPFNPDMLTLARECKGLSQAALAHLVGFKQATISRYESGLIIPPAEHVARIAQNLDRPVEYFYLEERMYGATSFFHRKRKSLSVTEERKIHAQVNELRIRSAILLRDAEIKSRFDFHRLIMKQVGGAPEQARVLRRLWQLPTGPIRSLVGAIERAGGIVFCCPFGTRKVDGISQWPLDDNVPPVFFVNSEIPGDRQRFTLAHEIGHLILHHLPTDDPEKEADEFASEFLMPAREIGRELIGLTLPIAAALKSHWKVSIAAIVRRAYDLARITERQYRYLNQQLAARGYKTCEPVPIAREEPTLFSEVLRVHRRSHGRHVPELSRMLGMHEHQFRAEFWNGMSGLRLVI
jgi:Zn-dependent peptidase ImmA (M78 family)/DNA-binding XRE family transcriptional regulator